VRCLTDQGDSARERERDRHIERRTERVLEGSLTLLSDPCFIEEVKCEFGYEVLKGCMVTIKQRDIEKIKHQCYQQHNTIKQSWAIHIQGVS
jgi:hypothetical protein